MMQKILFYNKFIKRLYMFRALYTEMHGEQNIKKLLSTYSWRRKGLIFIPRYEEVIHVVRMMLP